MPQQVLLDEGGSVSVHTRIKDMCKAARNRLHYTNQDICNKISERFGIEDFSVNTVNNFFSDRSKATTIYTTGYICAVLDISIDAVFGIENKISTPEEVEFIKQLSELKVEARYNEQEIEHLKQTIAEKDDRLDEVHEALEYYRKESIVYSKKVQPWVFAATLILLACAIAFICIYLLIFDVGNPDYGIFRQAIESANVIGTYLPSVVWA